MRCDHLYTAYEFTPAGDALLLALYDQACDASAQSPSCNIDSEPPPLNWTEIARDHYSHPKRSPKKLANSILPERLNHLKGRRLWLAERAKAYAELEESIAAARERLAGAGASAPEVGTNQQVRTAPFCRCLTWRRSMTCPPLASRTRCLTGRSRLRRSLRSQPPQILSRPQRPLRCSRSETLLSSLLTRQA